MGECGSRGVEEVTKFGRESTALRPRSLALVGYIGEVQTKRNDVIESFFAGSR